MNLTENADRLLFIIKTKGPQTAHTLAIQLGMTSMGARQHLQSLQQQDLVTYYDELVSVGRPKRFWQLTDKAQPRFPDTHSYLTVDLIESIQSAFGTAGIDRVIAARDKEMLKRYQQKLQKSKNIDEKVRLLAQLRSEEGYMAEYKQSHAGEYYLIENHCPICAAATRCQRFCQSELELFQKLFGKKYCVIREMHLLTGGQRCIYKITKK